MQNLFRHPISKVYALRANMHDVHQARRLSREVLKQVQHDLVFLKAIPRLFY
jgi:hypothetical protein